jgi:hypothetical protein
VSSLNLEGHEALSVFLSEGDPYITYTLLLQGANTEFWKKNKNKNKKNRFFPIRFPHYNGGGHGTVESVLGIVWRTFWYLVRVLK